MTKMVIIGPNQINNMEQENNISLQQPPRSLIMKKTIILSLSLLSITMPCLAPFSSQSVYRFFLPPLPQAPVGQSFNNYPRNTSDLQKFAIATAAIVAGAATLGLGTWFVYKKMAKKSSQKITGGAKATPKAS
jgi:phosphate/sulfate permease